MRTTLDLDDALIARAKVEAARQRTTLTRLIEEGLKLRLEQPVEEPGDRPPFKLRVFGDPNDRIDFAEYTRRVRAADEEWMMRQAGLLPFRDPGAPDE